MSSLVFVVWFFAIHANISPIIIPEINPATWAVMLTPFRKLPTKVGRSIVTANIIMLLGCAVEFLTFFFLDIILNTSSPMRAPHIPIIAPDAPTKLPSVDMIVCARLDSMPERRNKTSNRHEWYDDGANQLDI